MTGSAMVATLRSGTMVGCKPRCLLKCAWDAGWGRVVDFHCQLTQFFISGRPTHVLIHRRVSKRLVSSSAGHVPTKIRVSCAWKSTDSTTLLG